MSVVTSGLLRAHRITTTVLQAGDPEAAEAVVFLHGTPGCAAEWMVELLEGLGHWPHADAPDQVAHHLVPFLTTNTTPPG